MRRQARVVRGLASRLRLKLITDPVSTATLQGRQGAGISSEIETTCRARMPRSNSSRQGAGISSEIETSISV